MPVLFKSYTRTQEKAPALRHLVDLIAISREHNTYPLSGRGFASSRLLYVFSSLNNVSVFSQSQSTEAIKRAIVRWSFPFNSFPNNYNTPEPSPSPASLNYSKPGV